MSNSRENGRLNSWLKVIGVLVGVFALAGSAYAYAAARIEKNREAIHKLEVRDAGIKPVLESMDKRLERIERRLDIEAGK